MAQNEIGLDGIAFAEFSSEDPSKLDKLFKAFGFSKTMSHKEMSVDLYQQNKVNFLINRNKTNFSSEFHKAHGPCLSSMGWYCFDPKKTYELALRRGAKGIEAEAGKHLSGNKETYILEGIGGSLIYLVSNKAKTYFEDLGFTEDQDLVDPLGFLEIDHLTNNIYQGTLDEWSNFYKNIFEFTEVRYFDIRGAQTGLKSFALKSPCGKFCIPINEGTEKKSQINEYLEEYKGPGVQHIALTTDNIIKTIDTLSKTFVETLDIDDDYYKTVFDRVPHVSEDHKELERLNILVDGDEEGYLLQIFTKNIIGPIFFEIIQRKNHFSFGEGNFSALFRSIERDQKKRGFLD